MRALLPGTGALGCGDRQGAETLLSSERVSAAEVSLWNPNLHMWVQGQPFRVSAPLASLGVVSSINAEVIRLLFG